MTGPEILKGEGIGPIMTEEQTKQFRLQSRLRGLEYFQEYIKSGELLCEKDFAARIGRQVKWVAHKRSEGAAYAYAFEPQSVEEVCAAFPDKKPGLSVILDFVAQGKTMLYPAWQIRKKGVIRPEVAMARQAFNLYAKEVFDFIEQEYQKNPASWPAPKLDPPPDDHKLFAFFSQSGGLASGALSAQIVEKDKTRPKKPLTLEKLKEAWWYYENPFGGFS